jgi:hypothetical protein
LHEDVRAGMASRLDRALGARNNAEVAAAVSAAGFKCTGELVRRYRAGLVVRMDADFFAALARAYRISPEWLLIGEGPQMRGGQDAAAEAMNRIAALVDRYREGVGSTEPAADADVISPGAAVADARSDGLIQPAPPTQAEAAPRRSGRRRATGG